MSATDTDTYPRFAGEAPRQPRCAASRSETLELSECRAYDRALEIRHAYKLTGNFPVDLEIVLRDLGVLDQVTFEIKPKSWLSDCRRVEFRAGHDVKPLRFGEIMHSIVGRIGFDPAQPVWARLFG